MEKLEDLPEVGDKYNKYFREFLISSKPKKERLNRGLNLFFPESFCKLCDSSKVSKVYELQKIRKVPNPKIYSNSTKSTIIHRKAKVKYVCNSCGAESEDEPKLIKNVTYPC